MRLKVTDHFHIQKNVITCVVTYCIYAVPKKLYFFLNHFGTIYLYRYMVYV